MAISITTPSPGKFGFILNATSADVSGCEELKAAGEALFGERWQTDLAKELGLSDARRIRQWLKDERPIPVGIWADICGLLRQRENSINDVLKNLTKSE